MILSSQRHLLIKELQRKKENGFMKNGVYVCMNEIVHLRFQLMMAFQR